MDTKKKKNYLKKSKNNWNVKTKLSDIWMENIVENYFTTKYTTRQTAFLNIVNYSNID